MKKIILLSVFTLGVLCSQEKQDLELILQEFEIENTDIYRFGEDWVFIDEVYSNIQLEENIYILDSLNTLNSYLKDYSFDINLKYEYFRCDIYKFKANEGLLLSKSILLKDKFNIGEIQKTSFNLLKNKQLKTSFDCETSDVVLDNIFYTTSLKSKKIIIESDESYFHLSIFNANCDIYERIKIDKNEYLYLEEKDYFVFKGKQSLIIIADAVHVSSSD